jgi:hypothetical protein
LNKAAFLAILKQPDQVSSADTLNLRALAEDFPGAALIQMLYLKALQQENSFLFQKQLKRTAVLVPDRKTLYRFLNPEGSVDVATQEILEQAGSTAETQPADVSLPNETKSIHEAQIPKEAPAVVQSDIVAAADSQPSKEVVLELERPEPIVSPNPMGREEEQPPAKLVETALNWKKPEIIEQPEPIATETPEEKTQPEPVVSATRITETGKVEIDLDRLPPRAREVIEKSLALRARLQQEKAIPSDDHVVAAETNESPVKPLEPLPPETSKATTDSDKIVAPDLVKPPSEDHAMEGLSFEPETSPATMSETIAEPEEHSEAPISTQKDSVSQTAVASNNETSQPDAYTPSVGSIPAMPMLVFAATEIEQIPEPQGGDAGASPELFFEPDETPMALPDEPVTTAEPHTFFEWLQLAEVGRLPEKEIQKPATPAEKLRVIDDFLEKIPAIKPIKGAVLAKPNLVIQQPTPPADTLMTETLANVYVSQKHYDEAIRAYEILRLKYPEKGSYFADLISKVKKLKNTP